MKFDKNNIIKELAKFNWDRAKYYLSLAEMCGNEIGCEKKFEYAEIATRLAINAITLGKEINE